MLMKEDSSLSEELKSIIEKLSIYFISLLFFLDIGNMASSWSLWLMASIVATTTSKPLYTYYTACVVN